MKPHRGSRFVYVISWLIIFGALSVVWSQSLDIATRLTPWPPPGWPEGASGEVRLIAVGAEEGDVGLHFPVSDTGEVTYALPDTLPASGEDLYEPVGVAAIAPCDEVSPTVSPPSVEVAILEFRLYADDAPWGLVDMSVLTQGSEKVEGENLIGLLYAQAHVRVGGKGLCPGEPPAQARIDLDLREGRNFAVMQLEASYDGDASITLTTTESLELPGEPIPAGSTE